MQGRGCWAAVHCRCTGCATLQTPDRFPSRLQAGQPSRAPPARGRNSRSSLNATSAAFSVSSSPALLNPRGKANATSNCAAEPGAGEQRHGVHRRGQCTPPCTRSRAAAAVAWATLRGTTSAAQPPLSSRPPPHTPENTQASTAPAPPRAACRREGGVPGGLAGPAAAGRRRRRHAAGLSSCCRGKAAGLP